ncbi:DUF7288 family protein [Haloplanus halobius]|uniref:DUF7288 family protein n=1 Tax=Haloplanus halobius TaxID=2934938 RepID=UPI00200C9C0E|nr:hypothetical protein [Haloplanus sp. XH21]
MRGQAHTLEAFVAGLLVLSGIVFALQATAVTPLSASTSNQHVGNQERAMAAGVLETTDANGSLEEAIVYWNTTPDNQDRGEFYGANATDGTAYADAPPNAFGRALDDAFGERRTAFNVVVHSFGENASLTRTWMVRMGIPSSDAVTVGRQVTLFDDATFSSPEAGNISAAAANPDRRFYASDASRDGRLFNVVEVRITVWRI